MGMGIGAQWLTKGEGEGEGAGEGGGDGEGVGWCGWRPVVD